MEDVQSVESLMDSTSRRMRQLQKAFSELESHRAISVNFKWKELEEHFHGLQRSLKRRFIELEDQEKEFVSRKFEVREMLEKREASVAEKEGASLERLQEERDEAVSAITRAAAKDAEKSNGEEEGEEEERWCSPLMVICEQMDSNGLHRFISENRKNLSALKEKLPFALNKARDPAAMVVDLLEGFYGPAMEVKKDPNVLGLRRTCIMLMECLTGMPESVSEESKERARSVAGIWRVKLSEMDMGGSHGNSLEAHAFLQLLATFGLASEFDEEEFCRLVPEVSHRRQAADLCRTLGLSRRMPGVIRLLINRRRHVDAVNLAVAFDLTHQFSPATLLDSYLKTTNDGDDREMAVYRAVVKCVEEQKLEKVYPLERLYKRIGEMEKARVEKKVEAVKPEMKRPRPATQRLRSVDRAARAVYAAPCTYRDSAPPYHFPVNYFPQYHYVYSV